MPKDVKLRAEFDGKVKNAVARQNHIAFHEILTEKQEKLTETYLKNQPFSPLSYRHRRVIGLNTPCTVSWRVGGSGASL